MGFCPDFYQIKTFGVAVAPLYPRLLHQCTNGTVKLVERKRPSLLCEWLWFGSHLCSFRFGGSGHTFDGTGFYLLFESFQYFCVYALGFGFRFRVNETEVNVVYVSIRTTENYDVW